MGRKAKKPQQVLPVRDALTQAHRASVAQALRALRAHSRTECPAYTGVIGAMARAVMAQTWADCGILDRALVETGREPFYRELFAVFHDAAALHALWQVSLLRMAEYHRGKAPRFVELRAGSPAAEGKRVLHDLRELLRDGWAPEAALEILAPAVQRCTGDVSFQQALGGILSDHRSRPHRFLRSTPEWIVRAWMPLRLYECPADGAEAWERVQIAAALLRHEMAAEASFLSAWRNVRSRVFGKANPLFSQSAAAT